MRHLASVAVLLTATILVLASQGIGRCDTDAPAEKTDAKQAEATILGGWQAESVSMATSGGGHKTLTAADGTCSVVITDKKFTMCLGDKVLAEMTYVFDQKQDPWAIDLKSSDGDMLGICARKGGNLEISLNDEAKGRPRDFKAENSGMVLILRQFPGRPLFMIDADGRNLHQILGMPEFSFTGSADWSHDGRKIAIDSWRQIFGETCSNAHVFVINADGSDPKDLEAGAMPSWSPDDNRIAYTEYAPQRGIWTMNADGSDRRHVDPSGWGAQWSPKTDEIAYTIFDGNGAQLCINDLKKEQRRMPPHKSYRQIYWGLTWSPDGKWVCFKADLPGGGSEIAAVRVDGEKEESKVLLPSSATPEVDNAETAIAWGGPDNQILISMQTKTDRARQIYLFDFAGDKPPKLFPGQPADFACGDMAWSPDGKKVVFSAYPPKPGTLLQKLLEKLGVDVGNN